MAKLIVTFENSKNSPKNYNFANDYDKRKGKEFYSILSRMCAVVQDVS